MLSWDRRGLTLGLLAASALAVLATSCVREVEVIKEGPVGVVVEKEVVVETVMDEPAETEILRPPQRRPEALEGADSE
mgnify:CR=1 FL=1